MRKIYVASSWRNEFQPGIVEELKRLGHEVYDFRKPSDTGKGFAWSDIDPAWGYWDTRQYIEALRSPVAEKGFANDFDAMKWADTCVLILPCGRSANAEAGWMKGAGKRVFVYSPIIQEPELMYKMFDGVFGIFGDLRDSLTHFAAY